MSFRYSCYISYRETKSKLATNFIQDLSKELSERIAKKSIHLDIFMDNERFIGDEAEDHQLNRGKMLCESVCLIIIFTPTYFSKSYTLCSREYKAMEILETERLKWLEKYHIDKKQGLIIPIILRGLDYIPEEIKNRKCYDFQDFLLVDSAFNEREEFKEKIDDIANYILYFCVKLKDIPKHFNPDCNKFQLPSSQDDEFKSWLDRVSDTRAIFPGRSKTGSHKLSSLFTVNS